MAKFKTNLSRLMKEHNVSRMDLVRAADMTYPTVMSWENDALANIDATKMLALMKLFDCKMDDLVYIVEDDE